MVYNNNSNNVYHLTIIELAEEFESQFKCLGENPEQYITFFAPVK